MREDGSIDWDAAVETGQEAARYGKELWERINGVGRADDGTGLGADPMALLARADAAPRVAQARACPLSVSLSRG